VKREAWNKLVGRNFLPDRSLWQRLSLGQWNFVIWKVMSTFCNGCLSSFPTRTRRRSFSKHHCEKWVGLWGIKPIEVWKPLRQWFSRTSHSHTCPHSAPRNSSNLLFKYFCWRGPQDHPGFTDLVGGLKDSTYNHIHSYNSYSKMIQSIIITGKKCME
jgi:hypothetical protein